MKNRLIEVAEDSPAASMRFPMLWKREGIPPKEALTKAAGRNRI